MKCPLCGAPTDVLETRGVVRRRECFNGHRFTTDEVVRVKQAQPPQSQPTNRQASRRGTPAPQH